jgi:hypothetical protein
VRMISSHLSRCFDYRHTCLRPPGAFCGSFRNPARFSRRSELPTTALTDCIPIFSRYAHSKETQTSPNTSSHAHTLAKVQETVRLFEGGEQYKSLSAGSTYGHPKKRTARWSTDKQCRSPASTPPWRSLSIEQTAAFTQRSVPRALGSQLCSCDCSTLCQLTVHFGHNLSSPRCDSLSLTLV